MKNNKLTINYGGEKFITNKHRTEVVRTKSIEGAKNILSKRNITNVLSATFIDKTGAAHVLA